jgi:hypothetical protein
MPMNDVHADDRLRVEAEEIAGADVGCLDPAVRAHEDDAVRRGVQDLRESRFARLRGTEQARVLLVQVRLLVERIVQLPRRPFERLGFLFQLVDETARQADDLRRPLVPLVTRPRDHGDVQGAEKDKEEFRDLRRQGDGFMIQQGDVQDHGRVAERRQVRERERAPE